MKKNDVIDTKIYDVTIEGMGVGEYNGIKIFVPNTAIGDVIQAKILKIKKSYAFGKIENIKEFSKDRVKVDCKVYPKCGGCAFRHMSYESELKVKENHVKQCIERIAGLKDIKIEKIVASEKILGYRNKMQLPVKSDKNNSIITGFYRSHSHDVVATEECLLNPKIFFDVVNEIKFWMKKYNVSSYDERTGKGTVRHIYIRQSEKNRKLLICLVINSTDLEFKNELVESLIRYENYISGIICNVNRKNTNVILGEKNILLKGKDYMEDDLCGVNLRISSKAFYQINHGQTQKLYEIVKNVLNLKGNEKILEFFCGIGAIGLFLSKYVSFVTGVEISEESIYDAKLNATLNKINNANFICGDSYDKFNEAISVNSNPDIVILDPPRKGCSKELIFNISKIKPQKIAYISCDAATLSRDLKIFTENGFFVSCVVPVDMFPRTAHVETVVLLGREKSADDIVSLHGLV